ncbi:hypothetical protein ZOD2009_19143 [Haladaptatus paucihalophilus DX253]|uniref:Uncharacterized protein n=1 Tax=Haladaptatus paucihalophilus DX253 TaxID=797209 RepID=E7QYD8_HALPU|nr:hypothetical protein [Haladaptatus paucihalophilus]EFW90463.1 hypothetical protein ZOD2009_19143 [Haladaptatus paucihalophilus DX253]SHL67952.1 hypothetical protein SAMN05444342_4389 [Haladaptatus paucihalophilus DX253]
MGFTIPDVFDDILAELRTIRTLVANDVGASDASVDGTTSVHWFSTGTDRKPLDDEYTEEKGTWEPIEFGFRAKTVTVRTTDDVNICPVDPSGSTQGAKIRPDEQESPYSLGGDNGIDTETIWIQAAASATNTPKIEVQAFA